MIAETSTEPRPRSSADDAEMIVAVDRWARARRQLWALEFSPHAALVWALAVETMGTCRCCRGRGTLDEWRQKRVGRWGSYSEGVDTNGFTHGHWFDEALDETVCVAFRSRPCGACSGSGRFVVDVGRCPACVKRSAKRKLATDEWARCEGAKGPWSTASGMLDDHPHPRGDVRTTPSGHLDASRPCPHCAGTGRDRREVGRLLLDGLPRRVLVMAAPEPSEGIEPGDPVSIEALTVLADRLQFPEPSDLTIRPSGRYRNRVQELLGEAIAHLLAGRRERTAVVARILRLAAARRARRLA